MISVEQVVARRMDGLGELDLPRREVAVGVFDELIGEDEQAVERRPELVRHVREELGLVLRREGELLGLLLERLARLLDLAVLALDLARSAPPAASPSRSSALVCCSSSCWLWSSCASVCDCFSRSSVRMLASIVLSTMPIDSVS